MGKITYSTGYDKSKIDTYVDLIRYYSMNKEHALHDYLVFKKVKDVLEKNVERKIEECNILEIGCGQRFALTLLFNTIGVKVIGIDTDYVNPSFSFKNLLLILRNNGVERFIKTVMRHMFYDRKYYRVIGKELGEPLNFNNIDIRLMDVCSLRFPNDYFDFIFSNAVFEHIYDVDRACEETCRVCKKGGVIYISVDLFTSISGGHNLEWAHPDIKPSKKVPPWDHLREKLYTTHVYLNKLREKNYLDTFNRYFSIIDIEYEYEGEKYLTDDILKELKSYSRDELLKKTMKVIMKK